MTRKEKQNGAKRRKRKAKAAGRKQQQQADLLSVKLERAFHYYRWMDI